MKPSSLSIWQVKHGSRVRTIPRWMAGHFGTGASAGGAEAQLRFRSRRGRVTERSEVARAPGNEVFALPGRTETRRCPVAVLSLRWHNRAGSFRPARWQHGPPACEDWRGSSPAVFPRAPPDQPCRQTPRTFAFRRRSVRSRRTRSANTPRGTARCAAMSPYCQPSTIRQSSNARSSARRSWRRARSRSLPMVCIGEI